MVIFDKNSRKNKAQIKKYESDIRQQWDKVQFGYSLQQVFTPFYLVLEMLEKVRTLDNRDVCVIANSEIYLLIKGLKEKGKENFQYKSLTLITDIKSLIGKENIKVVNFNNLNKLKLDMKFDVVLANPPYNEDISKNSNRKGEHHLPSKQLHRVFFNRALDWINSSGKIAFVMPTNKWWFVGNKGKLEEKYKKQGLYRVIDKGNPFPPPTNINNVGIFLVDKALKVDTIEDDFKIEVLKNNITQFRIKTGIKAADFKKNLIVDSNGSTIRLTLKKDILRCSNPEISKDRSHGKWRVGLPLNGSSVEKMGTAITITPQEYLSSSVVAFVMDSKEQCDKFAEYLNSIEVENLVKNKRTSAVNSLLNLSFIPTPEWLQ